MNLEQRMREHGVVGHHRERLLANYKKLRRWIIGYCSCVAFLVVSWIGYIIADILLFHWDHHELIVFALVGAGLNIGGLDVIPIFKSLGTGNLKKAALCIDNLMYAFFNPNGKVSKIIFEVANTMIVLVLNILLFWVYMQLGAWTLTIFSAEYELIVLIALLFIYQYGLIPWLFSPLIKLMLGISAKGMQHIGIDMPLLNDAYIKETLKNNTYLLYLLFYITGKHLQVDPGSEVSLTVEAIGIVYLIDTYWQKRKACEKSKFNKDERSD